MTDLATTIIYRSEVSVLLGNGDGTFAAPQSFAAGSLPYSVTTGDFNGDGLTDLATANFFSNDVSVLLNQTGVDVLIGDVNRAGIINLLDVAPFVALFVSGEFQVVADINLDCVVDLLDVQAFVDVLINGRYQAEADINQDGVVSLLDVDPFVDLLIGG